MTGDIGVVSFYPMDRNYLYMYLSTCSTHPKLWSLVQPTDERAAVV